VDLTSILISTLYVLLRNQQLNFKWPYKEVKENNPNIWK